MSDGQGSASGVCCLYFFRHRALHYAFGDGEASVFVGYAAEAGTCSPALMRPKSGSSSAKGCHSFSARLPPSNNDAR